MFRIKVFLIAVVLALGNAAVHAQYKLTWIANTYGTTANHVNNCAGSMWVDPNGIVYTCSDWDENFANIGVYSNGVTIGAIGGTSAALPKCIAGDSADLFVELQGHNGNIGRFNRSSGVNDLSFTVTASTNTLPAGGAGPLIWGIADVNGQTLYISDTIDSLVQVWSTAGVFQSEWSVPNPGAIAVETNGAYLWVAQVNTGTVTRYSTNGTVSAVISLGANSSVSALYINPQNQLWVGDEGPDMNIKIYTNLTGTAGLSGTYGVTGGYLSTNGGAIMGTTGAMRFTRVVGIGSDKAGNVYVLNSPWGGTWDFGRNGGTDVHCYNSSGALQYTLQSLNFEGTAAADPGTDGTNLYSGEFLFSGTGGGAFVANTINPFLYPTDARLNTNSQSRGEDFGAVACVGTNRILLACGQNPDAFETYYFNAANGYVAVPGQTFGYTGARIRNGFQLEPTTGDIWLSYNASGLISHYPLTGFNTNGQPTWGTPITVPTPATIAPLNRLGYVPSRDTLVLAGGNSNWNLIGNRIEVYNGWLAGNTNTPTTVITLSRAQAKSMAVAGDYVFIGYYATNNIDVFALDGGNLVTTLTNSSSVYVGNDIDSMYGITAYKRANGEYQITKDDYNGSSVAIYTWPLTGPPDPPASLAANAVSASQVNLIWNSSITATAYNVKRSTVSGGPYTTVASGITATNFSDTGLSATNEYYYVVSAVNSAGESPNSAETAVFTLGPGWLTQDVGAVGVPGSVVYSNGAYIVSGSGTDITGTGDQFRFLYLGAGTSCSITARVLNVSSNANSAAKAGVMIRETLATNSTEASVTLTPANGVTWQYRSATNGTGGGTRIAGLVAPYWVRVVRSGSTFTGYVSPDGNTWTQEATTSFTMANTVYIGLAVTSRNNGALFTATFDNISASGTIPTPPAGMSATSVSNTQINLNWTGVSGATSYNVKRSAVSGGPYTTIASGVATPSYSDTGLNTATPYYYVVSAVNSGGESANSVEFSTTTLTTSPTGLVATAASSTEIDLTWAPVSGAIGYDVMRSTTSGGPYTVIAQDITSTNYADTGLPGSTVYYYVVSALDAGGVSANSTEVNASTILPPLSMATSGGQMLVFWPASAGTNYVLQMTTNLQTGPWITVTSAVPQVAFTISNNLPNAFYRIQ